MGGASSRTSVLSSPHRKATHRAEILMTDDNITQAASAAATSSVPPGRRGLIRSIVHRLAGEEVALPVEGRLPSFEGATGWLNSDPLTPEGLRGRVVLVDFWTYTCVNWLRTLPYLQAWAAKYRDDGLTVIGVHTPEFDFEGNIDNVIAQSRRLGVEYPIAVDSQYAVWRAFANHFWPALYIADAGRPNPVPSLRRGRVPDDRDGHPAVAARRRHRRHRSGPGDGRTSRSGSGRRLADAAVAGDVCRLPPEHGLRPGRRRQLRRASRLHAAGTAAPQ